MTFFLLEPCALSFSIMFSAPLAFYSHLYLLDFFHWPSSVSIEVFRDLFCFLCNYIFNKQFVSFICYFIRSSNRFLLYHVDIPFVLK